MVFMLKRQFHRDVTEPTSSQYKMSYSVRQWQTTSPFEPSYTWKQMYFKVVIIVSKIYHKKRNILFYFLGLLSTRCNTSRCATLRLSDTKGIRFPAMSFEYSIIKHRRLQRHGPQQNRHRPKLLNQNKVQRLQHLCRTGVFVWKFV
jgi:hypothetical protein